MRIAVRTSLFLRLQHDAVASRERASGFDVDADGVALVAAGVLRVDVDGVRRSHLQAAEEHGAAGGAAPVAAADTRPVGQSRCRIPYGIDPSRACAVAQVGRRSHWLRRGRRRIRDGYPHLV